MSLRIFPASIKPPVENTLGADFITLVAWLAAAALLSSQLVFTTSHDFDINPRTLDFRALQAVHAFERFVRFGRGPLGRKGSSGWKGAITRRDSWFASDVMLLDGEQGG